jgi:nitrite reductase/ring-hydroxylating ferredoxin subunit
MSEYIKVGSLDNFKTKNYKCIRYLSKHIGVFKKKDGSIYALEVDCKHQNANLLSQPPKNNIAVCIRHGWKYDLTTGECITEPWAKLRNHPVKIEDGIIFVGTNALDHEKID